MDTQQIGSTLYRWSAAEFTVSANTPRWYIWAGGGALVVLLGVAIFTKQWIGAALVVMIGVALYLLRTSAPRVFEHAITERGVVVGEKFYPYSQLQSFWILLSGGVGTLNLLSNKKFGLVMTLQLGEADIEKIRGSLSGKLPEDASRGEDMVDRVGKLL